jgi:hypothetical protein
MSRLHARAVPWLLLACFLAAALTLFSLAAGGDAVRLNGVLSLAALWSGGGPGEVRQGISRTAVQDPDAPPPWIRAEEDREVAVEPSDAPVKEKRAKRETPRVEKKREEEQRIESQRFRETSSTFKAMFRTSRNPGDARLSFRRNPARWVVDLDGKWGNASARIYDFPGHFIRRVSVEPRDGFLRITFSCADLSASSGAPAKLEKESEGFTVIIPKPRETAGAGESSEREHDGR